MSDNLNNQNNNNEDFNFRKQFENQKKELANMQRMTQSYHTVTLPENAGESYVRKGFHFKFRYLVIFLVLSVVGIYFYNYYTVNKEHLYDGNANIESLYDKNNLIRFVSSGLYGYVDYNGNKVIDSAYSEATDFYNGFAMVGDGVKKYIINTTGKQLFEVQDGSYGYNKDYDYWFFNNTLYSGQVLKYQDNVKLLNNTEKYFYYYEELFDKTRIIDFKGQLVYELDGKDYIIDVKKGSFTDDLIYVEKGNKYLIINPESKNAVYDGNEKITLLDGGVYKKDRLYFIYDDETFYPYEAENVVLIDKEKKILKIEEKESSYYFDLVNNTKLESFEELNDIKDSQFKYDIVVCGEDNNKYGLKKDGQYILECKYDNIEFLNDGLHEYIRKKNGQEYVFVQNVEISSIYNLRIKRNVLEEDYVTMSYLDGSAFVAYSPEEENEDAHITVYNVISNEKKKYAKNDYLFYTSGYNYYVLHNTRNAELEYYNYEMKKIYSVKYDVRIEK